MFPVIKKFPIEGKNGLYCTWIRQSERPGAPLVAVWIAPSMSCFRGEAETGQQHAEEMAVADDNGGVAEMPPPPTVAAKQKWTKAIRALAAMLLWMLAAMAAHGQTSRRIIGVVRDPSGAVIPG